MDSNKDGFWEYIDSRGINYEESIFSNEGDLYERTGALINSFLEEGKKVLDIGNGGVINYDHSKLKSLVCADLEVADRVMEKYRRYENIRFVRSNIMNMSNIDDKSFDIVIVQNVIHHLAGPTYQKSVNNLHTSIEECMRVLDDDGMLIILESTLKPYAFVIERLLYKPMMKVLKLIKFDQVFQYSKGALRKALETHKRVVIKEDGYIPEGKYTIYVGKRIPSVMLPLTFSYFVIEKK